MMNDLCARGKQHKAQLRDNGISEGIHSTLVNRGLKEVGVAVGVCETVRLMSSVGKKLACQFSLTAYFPF